LKGEISLCKNDTADTIQQIRKIDSLPELHWYSFYLQGLIKEKSGSYEDAIKNYDNAIKEGSVNPFIYVNKAYSLEKIGKIKDAIASLELFVKIEPHHYKAKSVIEKIDELKKSLK
jgi:tetratricopeptide (TPR) repeat protein